MSEDLHEMDDLFKKAIDDYKEAPSEQVWGNIDKNLDKKKVVFISEKYNKLKWLAAALLIFSAGMAMYTWNTKLRNKELVKINNANRKRKPISSDNKITHNKTDDKILIADKVEKTTKDKVIDENVNKIAAKGKKANALNKVIISKKENVEKQLVKNIEKPKTDLKNTKPKNEEPAVADQLNGKEKVAVIDPAQKDKLIINDKEAFKTKTPDNIIDLPNLPEEKPRLNTDLYIVKNQMPDTTLSNTLLRETLKTRNFKNPITSENKAVAGTKTVKAISAKQSKVSSTIFFSSDFVSTHLDNDHSDFREEERDEIKKDEKQKFSSTFGVLLNYSTGKNWNISAGITYSSIVTDITPKILYARPDAAGNINYRFNCSAGYSYITVQSRMTPPSGDTITALSSKNTLQYMGVPFSVSYNITKGKFVLTPGLGITANFLTKGNIETVIEGADAAKTINHIDGLKSNYFNGALSFGANYTVSKTIALSFMPVARFALTSINKDAQVKTYLNSVGLVAGLTFRL